MIPSCWERLSSLIDSNDITMIRRKGLNVLGLFLVTTLLLVGCKKPDASIGNNLQPDGDLLQAQVTDSIFILAQTERVDSLRTDLFANMLVGNYSDPLFGAVKCRGVLQFSPDLTLPEIPSGIEVYETALSLAYQAEAYGNNDPMFFVVQELNERIYLDSAYYNNSAIPRQQQNLILPGEETQVTRAEYAPTPGAETREYLNLPLKPSFGTELLSNRASLASFDSLNSVFNGLMISSLTTNGRVLHFSTIDSKITVKYRFQKGGQSHIGQYVFSFTSSCEAFSLVEHQYQGSGLSALSSGQPMDNNTLVYLQAGGGTRVRVNIGDVRWLQRPGVVINKAELVLPYQSDWKLAPVDSVNVIYEKTPGNFSLTNDSYLNPGGNFRKSATYYRFNITNHVQSMISGELEQNELLLVASPRVSGYYNSMGVRRSVLNGPQFQPEDNTQNMRLVVTYSTN